MSTVRSVFERQMSMLLPIIFQTLYSVLELSVQLVTMPLLHQFVFSLYFMPGCFIGVVFTL